MFSLEDIHISTPGLDARTIKLLTAEGAAAKRLGMPREHGTQLRSELIREVWLRAYDAEPDPVKKSTTE